MISEACPSSGRNPWATVCRNPASCGCRTSRKVKVRSSIGGAPSIAPFRPPRHAGACAEAALRALGRDPQLAAGVVLDLRQAAHLDLPDTLAGEVQDGADLFQGDAAPVGHVEG